MMNATTPDTSNDARHRLMLAVKDLEVGLARVRGYYRLGLLTDEDFTDRVAFLQLRYTLAAEDFRRNRRGN